MPFIYVLCFSITIFNAKYTFFSSILIICVNVASSQPLINLNNRLVFFKHYLNRFSDVVGSVDSTLDVVQAFVQVVFYLVFSIFNLTLAE